MEETIINVIVLNILAVVLGLQIQIRNFNQKYKELLRNPHNHLICNICGSVVNIDTDVDKSLVPTEKLLQQGFDVKGVYIDFYGVCPKCKKIDSPPDSV